MAAQAAQDVFRYNPVCLIGNWNEDRELQRSILKDLLGNKARGTLKVDRFYKKMEVALSEVELTTVAADGYVHFGDVLQFVHVDTGCVLSGDVSDKDSRPGEDSCTATAAPEVRAPCHRNTFVLVKYRAPRTAVFDAQYDDDVLHYGQKFRLALHAGAQSLPMDSDGGPRPLYLFSKPVTTTHFARCSHSQLVGLTWRRDASDTIWQVVTPDPKMRAASDGVEVMAGAPIMLIHVPTQRPLCLEPHKYPNDFGSEMEISAKQATPLGLKLSTEQAALGVTKSSMPKMQLSDNYWTILTGPQVGTLPSAKASVEAASELLARISLDLGSKVSAMPMLEKKLIVLESADSRFPVAECALVFAQVGVMLSDDDVRILAANFPTDRPGFINSRDLRNVLKLQKSLQ
eukprot:CAMPEP_0175071794 /NCGR_PEP_ID=MMETSP0052_2-20121109/19464_1 /TAXON_ID=51329 ORGANISM="Polytomella parva, Strain SAG 63-3" /NCGR_SAMPLE_ID=MMETSP0052_2 /ASSEMBLY_ACC=CAM_ASM_000194 /LENGTH=401 /DNA_ID=CAMNT_0016339051 /DNA_START=18 /DNA_END=1223 /DNA_ORIENTATION=+